MGLYAFGMMPLMKTDITSIESEPHFHNNPFQKVVFTDNFTGFGILDSLKLWFCEIWKLGHFIENYFNPLKLRLIVTIAR